MATNPYFNHVTNNTEERDLFQDLATEIVQMAGVDVKYIRVENLEDPNFDSIFGENRFEKLGLATTIEMFFEDMESGYDGTDMFAKFGLMNADRNTFIVSYKRWNNLFSHRPHEGDYIYIPSWDFNGPDDIFKVAHVDITNYQNKPLGTSIFYFLKCERAKWNHQEVNTGVLELDQGAIDNLNNGSVQNDTNADNDAIQDLSDAFIDFSENNPFGTP